MSRTKIRTALAKLLTQPDCTADKVLDLIQQFVITPAGFAELFPEDRFAGSVRVRSDRSARGDQAAKANRASLVVKTERREERKRQVLECVRELEAKAGRRLMWTELCKELNTTSIKPARGDLWSVFMLQRLIGDERGE